MHQEICRMAESSGESNEMYITGADFAVSFQSVAFLADTFIAAGRVRTPFAIFAVEVAAALVNICIASTYKRNEQSIITR